MLNDSCFKELDASVEMLKKYDAISYFELEGIGKRYDYIKSAYTVPFLQSTNPSDLGVNINRQFMDRLLNEIEEHLRETSKKISKSVYRRIEEKITYVLDIGAKEIIEEFNAGFYEMVTEMMPEEIEKPSYDDFVKEFRDPEVQDRFVKQFQIMAEAGLDQVMTLIMQNPSLTLEQVEELLRNNQVEN